MLLQCKINFQEKWITPDSVCERIYRFKSNRCTIQARYSQSHWLNCPTTKLNIPQLSLYLYQLSTVYLCASIYSAHCKWTFVFEWCSLMCLHGLFVRLCLMKRPMPISGAIATGLIRWTSCIVCCMRIIRCVECEHCVGQHQGWDRFALSQSAGIYLYTNKYTY